MVRGPPQTTLEQAEGMAGEDEPGSGAAMGCQRADWGRSRHRGRGCSSANSITVHPHWLLTPNRGSMLLRPCGGEPVGKVAEGPLLQVGEQLQEPVRRGGDGHPRTAASTQQRQLVPVMQPRTNRARGIVSDPGDVTGVRVG